MPKDTQAKMEIKKKTIVQDKKKGKPRFIKYLPQTYESPYLINTLTGLVGKNDPLDIIELSNESISTSNPLSKLYNDINDIPINKLNSIKEWLRNYKMKNRGKPMNNTLMQTKQWI
jgi:inorganic pyrophosphatase